jgi:hypothetical protein
VSPQDHKTRILLWLSFDLLSLSVDWVSRTVQGKGIQWNTNKIIGYTRIRLKAACMCRFSPCSVTRFYIIHCCDRRANLAIAVVDDQEKLNVPKRISQIFLNFGVSIHYRTLAMAIH